VEFVGTDFEGGHLIILDFDAFWIAVAIGDRSSCASGQRSTSHLAALIDLVLAHPIASAGLIAKELRVRPRAAQNLLAELGLREATGRGRYRTWEFCEGGAPRRER
jgi:hypothetical protein